jgi:hypothetical protein
MLSEKLIRKIERVIPKDQIKSLQDIVVYQDPDGTYQLFETYSIEKIDSTYVVSSNSLSKNLTFSVLKNAVTWCTYDKRNKILDANTIVDLDHRLSRIDSDITIRQAMAKKAKNPDDKLIFIAKIGEDKLRRKQMVEQLDGYIRESRNWQTNRLSKS